MSTFVTIILVISALGLVGLFVLKALEVSRGFVFAPTLRNHADEWALRLKTQLNHFRMHIGDMVPIIGLIGRRVVHECALGFAGAAHWSARQAHRLADAVSHKHRFERHDEPRSTFLKEVAEVKNIERPTIVPALSITEIAEERLDPMPASISVASVIEQRVEKPVAHKPVMPMADIKPIPKIAPAEPSVATSIHAPVERPLVSAIKKTVTKTPKAVKKKLAAKPKKKPRVEMIA